MIQHFVPSKCNDVNALVVSTQSVRGDNKMLILSTDSLEVEPG